MPGFQEDSLPYQQLLLDPNNYRYQDGPDFVYADERRFHESGVQDRAYRRLKNEESLVQLKNSFKTNGFIPIERLVVRPYAHAKDKYLVLEGNRRLAALMWIAEDHEAGVDTPQSILDSLTQIPVVIVDEGQDSAFYEALMGVRHVSGIKEWSGYQRAKLVVKLRDGRSLGSAEVADRLGMLPNEVNRRYRAYKALEQMEEDEEFGAYAKADLYPLFHEAVSIPVVREWLGWDQGTAKFLNYEHLIQFYQLITPMRTPNEAEGQSLRPPKIPRYVEVRHLKEIIPNPEAKRMLLDSQLDFLDAVAAAKRTELSRSWSVQVAEAITAMETISALDLLNLPAEDLAQINRLRDVANTLLETHRKLTC